jgi:flavin prenyltransferase
MEKSKIIVAITGASGSIYGWRLLQLLQNHPSAESHLVLSRSGERTAFLELQKTAADFKNISAVSYPPLDIGAPIASGSFPVSAMVVAPCSIHTLSAVAHGITDNLITRAADVCLKERRRLILMVRETPFHLGHLRSMAQLAEMGAIIAPPIPGFYHSPKSIEDLVDHSLHRILDLVGLPSPDAVRWSGAPPSH